MPKIFLSYAHIDRAIKSELVRHFDIIDNAHNISVWHDDYLRGGEYFDPAIEQAIRSSDYALLLVSHGFLGSEYICKQEYPLIAELEKLNRITVFAAYVGAVTTYANPSILKRSLDFFDRPLRKMTVEEREEQLARFVDRIVAFALNRERQQPKLTRGLGIMAPETPISAVDAVAVDETAARLLLRAGMDEFWFSSFPVLASTGIRRSVQDGICYLFGPEKDRLPRKLIIFDATESTGVFGNKQINPTLFRRGLQVALARWFPSLAVPASWKAYHSKDGQRLSIYPGSVKRSRFSRLHVRFDESQVSTAYVHFLSNNEITSLDSAFANQELFDRVIRCVVDASIDAKEAEPQAAPAKGVVSLEFPISGGFETSRTFDDWFSLLTAKQREFVETPISGPIRVRGPAGTGKTLALVMKLMFEARKHKSDGKEWRAIFLTHSQSTVSHAWNLLDSIDSETLISVDDTGPVRLQFQTIYDLARSRTLETSPDLEPLSTDGRSGRDEQRRILHEVIEDVFDDDNTRKTLLAGTTASLKSDLDGAYDDPASPLIYELLNEFASKLDGEGLDFASAEDMNKYINDGDRPAWLLPLPSKPDRRLVWNLYRRYCDKLSERGLLSLDQVVADLARELGSNRYRARRELEGFDAIFVDEAHLFSHIERSTLDKLLRKPAADYEGGPPIILAHDSKQSPDNRFTQLYDREHSQRWIAASAQNAKTHLFNEVHRYTPEISALVAAIDRAFPQFLIGDDWVQYTATSKRVSGPTPTLSEHTLFEEAIDHVGEQAAKSSAGRQKPAVAVLCMDDRQFETIVARLQEKVPNAFAVIEERGDQSVMQQSRNKFILSLPEYIAGLQFDTVFILGADRDLEDRGSDSERRKYLSNLYVGVTRAERVVHIACCSEFGGRSGVVLGAMADGSLVRSSEHLRH